LNLLVTRQPKLQVGYYQPVEDIIIGETFNIPIEIVNIGRYPVNISTVEISSPNLAIENSEGFIGLLDGGTAGSLDIQAKALESGEIPLLVKVNFLDDFNQPQTINESLSLVIIETNIIVESLDEENDIADDNTSIWAKIWKIITGLFGFGS